MIQRISKTIFTIFILTSVLTSNACTIFMANDGQHVWIGNNEDEAFSTKYRMWYYPARKGDFGYMIWTELTIGKLFYGFMYKNPQGGLNEHGLFMDYTAIDNAPVTNDPDKKNRKKELVHDILKSCKTVDEAIQYIGKYNLVRLKGAQLYIADATGNYATVHGGYIIRKTDNNFALTNYCINNGHKEACYRRDVATNYLNAKKTFQLEDIKNILQKSSQKPPQTLITNYSMAVDLKTGTIYLYYKNDFATEKIINLKAELQEGKHHKDLVDYFPKDIAGLIEAKMERNGINEAVLTYKELREKSFDQYNFRNNSVLNLCIKWIDKGKVKEAISLLETIKEFEPGKATIYTWLGVAYRKDNNLNESAVHFNKALELNPGDYLATLWGRQTNQKVIFRLNDFEGAEAVSLMGEFTQWTQHAIKMTKENGVWTCEAIIPKGENRYKFRVNNENLTDKINLMYVGTGPDMYSKIYVW
ncbi:MAG: tetratricopeptide repeat protein [Bacteroidetes bacterium]|nr:tetratricopeptide repeat protein [Bacteroidota bacterium]